MATGVGDGNSETLSVGREVEYLTSRYLANSFKEGCEVDLRIHTDRRPQARGCGITCR
jgi:hypothetical protein